jgi:hypothetical protein
VLRYVERHRRWVVALPLLVLLYIGCRAFLATDNPQRRYATLPDAARVLFRSREPIDFVVVGTSRAMFAIDEAAIAAAATVEAGAAPVVADLSHTERADGQIYRMLQDLFSRRSVRQAVLYEISRREDRVRYYHYYPNYCVTGTFRDLLEDFASKPREPRLSRVRDLLELIVWRLDKSLTLLLRGRNKNSWGRPPVKRLLGEMDTARVVDTPEGKEKKRLAIEAAYGSWDKAPASRWSLDDINEDRANYYLRKTIALCRERNVTPIFFHVPGYLEAPLSEDTKREFQEWFGFPLLAPPVDVLARLYDSKNFRDVSHLIPEAGAVYSAWLAGAMQSQLQRAAR